MNALKTAFALLVLLAPACATWEPRSQAHVLIETEGFTPSQIVSIHAAMTEWEEALDGYVSFDYVDQKGPDNLIVVRARTRTEMSEEYVVGRVGETSTVPWESGGGIEVDTSLPGIWFQQAFAHEVGHVLGLSHTKHGTLMTDNIRNGPHHVTCADVTQFCDKHDCNAAELPICQTGVSSL